MRETLRAALRGFDEVQSGSPTPDLFAAAEADRQAEGYGPLLDLCRLLADALGPTEAAGPTACPAFLLDMERVFERYVTRGVLSAFAGADGWTAAAPETHEVAAGLEMRPDVTVVPGRPAGAGGGREVEAAGRGVRRRRTCTRCWRTAWG